MSTDPDWTDDDDPDEISARLLREEQARHRLGVRDGRCSVCGEDRAIVLLRLGPRILCQGCDAEKRGRTTVELHHPFGRNNSDVVVPINVNDHRDVTDRQNDWPKDTLINPGGSDLRRSAATIRGFIETSIVLLDGLSAIPELLEVLDDELAAGASDGETGDDPERRDNR